VSRVDAIAAYIGIGSNLDDPERQVRRAIAALAALPETRFVRASRLFRTAPWGRTDQPAFVNAAAEISTTLAPRSLLDALLAIERAQGRHRDATRWGPRTIDLDVLLYGDAVVEEPGLSIPHPHLAERAFVLLPLAELAPALHVPGRGRISELLGNIEASGVEALP
jgi:2-amino-4-hydroxy-6-hydroxymethyldihydropteridine diphosphokinase